MNATRASRWLGMFVAMAMGCETASLDAFEEDEFEEGEDTDEGAPEHDETDGVPFDPEFDHHDDFVLLPDDAQGVGLSSGEPQVVYVAFDAVTIQDCAGCSNAAANQSFIVGVHFKQQSITIPAWGTSAERAYVLAVLRSAFDPYRVVFTTTRPAQGPYQMLAIGHNPAGPAGGVAPLDCGNSQPNDVAFVYRTDSGVDWVARAAVHELGHSFGLEHVHSASDFMHPHAAGNAFTHGPLHESASNHCVAGPNQDAPTLLAQALESLKVPCAQVKRRAGANRYATAAQVSAAAFPGGANAAVLASGNDGSPDALTAGPLAHRYDAPLLLSRSDDLPLETRNELLRLKPQAVYIVGGATAVSDNVRHELTSMGFVVERISGPDRFSTAAVVAQKVQSASGLAFIASGDTAHLVDAVAASGPAAGLGAPVLLVTRDSIPDATAQALSSLAIGRTIVAGGSASISDAVLNQLPQPVRASGPSRYETAVAVARAAMAEGLSAQHVFVARGDVLADALSAGAIGHPVVLSRSDRLVDAALLFLHGHAATGAVLGGSAALAHAVERDTCAAIPSP